MALQCHNPFARRSPYCIFDRFQTSLRQSLPTKPFGTRFRLLRLFSTVSSIITLTLFTVANAEFESCAIPNIRLYGGKTKFDGGLLVQTVDGQWQRLCLQWDYADLQLNDLDGPIRIAQVICRSLGFRSEKASAVFYENHTEQLPGISTDFITTLSLKCQGNESQVSECHPLFQEVNISRLKFSEVERICFSGIACGDDLQFAIAFVTQNNSSPQQLISFINETLSVVAAGLLEATAFDLKGPVCADQGNVKSHARIAQVACREMGLRANASFQGVALRYGSSVDWFDDEVSPIRNISCLMVNTTCTGREKSIAECSHQKLWGLPELSLESSDGWYGEQVLIACLMKSSDGLQLTTGRHLVNRSTGDEGVFIKYGSTWLPVVNSSDPYSCRAICNALHTEGPSMAICHTETLIANHERQSSGVAFIFCDAEETDVNRCAHFAMGMKFITAESTSSDSFQHVHARCIPLWVNNTSGFNLELQAFHKQGYRGNVTSGSLQLSLEDHMLFLVAAETSESAQFTANMICRRIFPTNKTYASYINFNKFDPSIIWNNPHMFRGPTICPLASAFIGCQPNVKSINDCAIQLARQSTHNRCALGIICAPALSDIEITHASSVLGHDGIVTLFIGPYRAFGSVDGWSDIMASVACREKRNNNTEGHRAIKKAMYYSSHEWLLTNVICTGLENALLECKHDWTATWLPLGSYVAGISCGRNESKVQILPFSNRSNSGYPAIETYVGGSRGRVFFCAVSTIRFANASEIAMVQTTFDIAFCRAAGYPRTKHAVRLILSEKDEPKTSGFHLFQGVYAFRNFVCHEKNSSLEECSWQLLAPIRYCPRPEISAPTSTLALALRCDEHDFGTEVRLVGGATPYEGHVEVMYKGEWGAVCDDRFDMDASTVVCRQLFGPMSQGTPVPGSRFVTKNERFLLDEVRCSPTDKTLAECTHNEWGDHDCGPCEQVGVICSKVNFIRQPVATLDIEGGRQQLVCVAEGQPPPSYQWFTTGAPLMVAGDRVDIVCQEIDKVNYTCNAFNDAGESFVQVVLDRKTTCEYETVGNSELSTSNSWMVTLIAVAIAILLLLLLGAVWKIFSLRIALKEVHQSKGNEQTLVSYVVLNESPCN